MTINEATPEQRATIRESIKKIIGDKEDLVKNVEDRAERIQMRFQWDKQYEKLEKIFYAHGAKALALNFVQEGLTYRGVTANGKGWTLYMNNGYTARSRYCGTLYIEGEGMVFTSGRLDKVFDYILAD